MAANLAFSLCAILTGGAIEALLTAGSDEAQEPLPAQHGLRQVDWHHEPDRATSWLRSGSGSLQGCQSKTTAPTASLAKRSSSPGVGTTWWKTVHLVLARTPDAPEGVKGISLFVVPKVHGQRRRLAGQSAMTCSALPSKKSWASRHRLLPCWCSVTTRTKWAKAPSATWLAENRGLEYMFIMMNAARYDVGIQVLLCPSALTSTQ